MGRGIRYFGQGYLAVRYGERAIAIVQQNGVLVSLALAALAEGIGVAYYVIRKRSV